VSPNGLDGHRFDTLSGLKQFEGCLTVDAREQFVRMVGSEVGLEPSVWESMMLGEIP